MRPAAALFLGLAFFLSWNMTDPLHAALGVDSSGDPMSRLLGSAKEVVGDSLFIKADEYFHGGVQHEHHHDETAEDLAREGVLDASTATAHEHEDWIARINHEVGAHELMHLAKTDRKELLPFFGMAVALDPNNVEAVLTTAYWLDREFGKAEEARRLLEKGIRDNPSAWELERELAKLLTRTEGNSLAEAHFREAVRKSEAASVERFERVSLFYDWGQVLARMDRRAEAAEVMARAEEFFDEKTTPHLQGVILERIKELSAKK